ncbi:MAG: Rne/Rng family ribonuclease [Candidatus Omnitrophica bacterium]|nr:Rne/Rng family ribonuclease [Candidatus Omnitrophota bacterium]
MKNREIIISSDEQEKRVAILEDGKLEEFFLERNKSRHLAGNIYKGKVAQVVKGMEAAFIDIGLEKNGFLYIQELLPETVKNDEYAVDGNDEPSSAEQNNNTGGQISIENLLNKGQDVIVQVVKEPFGTKGCRLTSQISLPGRFLVLMPYSNNIGISKRITDEKERQRLKELLKEIGLPKEMGCIMRTQAAKMGRKEFDRELKYLLRLWQTIKRKSVRKNAPYLIHEEFDLVLRTARDLFGEEISQMIIDSRDDYKRVLGFIKTLAPQLQRGIKLYKDKMPLFEKNDVEKQIEEIFAQQIVLRRGGYIVIERTEALISIDVNSGRFVTRGRLPLGIVQIARQRVRKSLESIMFSQCAQCKGMGIVKSPQTIAFKVLRQIKYFLMSNKKRYLEVCVHPQIAMRLFNEERSAINTLEKRYWLKIAILTDEHLGIEEVKFL